MNSKNQLWKALLISSFFIFSPILLAQGNKKPNLLFIMTDQQRFDAMSGAGNKVLKTPNMDRLAKQGAKFKNAYTPCAVCGPARSSILTGTTVENNGMKVNEYAYSFKKEGVMTMPTFDEILAKKGYHSEYFGKWHTRTSHADVYKNPQKTALNGGSVFGPEGALIIYEDFLNAQSPNRDLKVGELYDTYTKRPYKTNPLDKFYGKTDADVKQSKRKPIQPDLHGELLIDKEYTMTAFQAKQTIDALERLKDSAFSITCSFHFPHAPMLPTKPYSTMYPAKDMVVPISISDDMQNSPYTKANGRLEHTEYADPEKIKYMISSYYGLVKEIDDWVGKILDKVDELGLADNTLVIFTSDHGEMLGAHGMREKNVFYEESAHIPLILRFPGQIKSKKIVKGYTSTVDLFPTILDYLNVEEHKSDGKSLRGLMEGTDKNHGKYVVQEWDYRGDTEPNYMIVKDGYKLMIPYTETSKVINAMYNLKKDPNEMNNLLGGNPDKQKYLEKAEDLRKSLIEWLTKNKSSHIEGVQKRKLI
ncbi:MAG: sulfatase-like hydrolase/transferase [Flavobacterium sp.]|nr:sulfatase-like hydrolase/transferase [Flavobacterium sp.]